MQRRLHVRLQRLRRPARLLLIAGPNSRDECGTSQVAGDGTMTASWPLQTHLMEDARVAAWELFVRYADQRFSFTDCTSFALMRAIGIAEAFTFDRRDYAAAGFGVLP